MFKHSTNEIIMVRPKAFHFNPSTIFSNVYQKKDNTDPKIVQQRALLEFDLLVKKLKNEGIKVNVIEDKIEPKTTDCIFPNNWFSIHEDNKLVIYSMFSENRRYEKDKFFKEVLEIFQRNRENVATSVIDYSNNEDKGIFLEGTGAMVIDRKNKVAYCALSNRADKDLFLEFCKDTHHQGVYFEAFQDNKPIYHTNVLMGIGPKNTLICMDAIKTEDREKVRDSLIKGGNQIIEITPEQVKKFLGNTIELKGRDGDIICMSKVAYDSLSEKQIKMIEKDSKILYSDISTIEFYGGGSLRCMIAEVF